MKVKILIIVLLMGLSTVLVAQTTGNDRKNANRGSHKEMRMDNEQRGQGLNLTDNQKEAFKLNMLDVKKQVQPLRNELGEAEAHQKTLVSIDKPDVAAINKNIEKIGAIRVEISKIKVKHRLEMRSQLTDEQKLKFDHMKGRMRLDNGLRGMEHNRHMQRDRAMN